jgi:50S ribosomal subunit-associated GTPase HflX
MKAHRAYIKVWNKIDAEVDIDTIPPDPTSDHVAAAARVRNGLAELEKPLGRLRKAMRRDVTK